jgi:hypothetical protein
LALPVILRESVFIGFFFFLMISWLKKLKQKLKPISLRTAVDAGP